MPASRSARAMIFAPRSCPSRPGLATTTRILRVFTWRRLSGGGGPPAQPGAERERHQAQHGQAAGVDPGGRKRGARAVAGGGPVVRGGAALVARGVAAAAPAVAAPRARGTHGDGAAHLRVGLAEVLEGARLIERVRAALAGLEDAGVEAAVVGRGGVRRGALVGTGNRVTHVHRDRGGGEVEVADRHRRVGGGGGPRGGAIAGALAF